MGSALSSLVEVSRPELAIHGRVYHFYLSKVTRPPTTGFVCIKVREAT